ncbi:CIC11C00000001982 [Sungouiella intermedia]|uniref:CIC11C00000001982 n=1 Tax=Sungouiella intermedia TaxID=45354 RepID=A0A1L0D0L2_9ASCO|nr:CIC11C00000001982 [[Candida] intermedia]
MAQVSLPPDGPYARRVSFNNLHPDDLESGTSKFYSYNVDEQASTRSNVLEVNKLFGNYTMGPVAPTVSRKRVRLPDPPSKLILKNKLTPTQLLANLLHAKLLGVSYHGDLNDLVKNEHDGTVHLEADGVVLEADASDSDDDEDVGSPPPQPTARRKLYSQMTDEELMALDPQFAKPRTSSIDNFKFDSSTTYYSTARRASTGSAAIPSQAVSKQIVYPSLNENNYKSMSLTVRHEDYDVDSEATRTLLTVISGRKHTWNSLDWLLLTENGLPRTTSFLQNGDCLVIAGLVPLKFMDGAETIRKQHSLDDKLYQKCNNLLNYVLENLPDPLLRLKITVEFVLDIPPSDPLSPNYKKNQHTGTRFMLEHLFKQYQPTLVIVGNKSTNLNFKYPIRKRRQRSTVTAPTNPGLPGLPGLAKIPLASTLSSDNGPDAYLIKLSSFLIKYLTVPLIMVGNSTVFHHKTEFKHNTAVTFSDSKPPQAPRSILEPERKNSNASDISIESFNGNGDSQSFSSLETPEELQQSVNTLLKSQSPDRFATMLDSISQYSLAHLKYYLNVVHDDTIEKLSPRLLNSKVHQVYSSIGTGKSLSKSHSNGASGKAYKVKSLISYSEEEEKKNEKMINEKKLKKSVSRGSVNTLASADDKKPKKKKSFLQKLGMKK